MKLSDEKEGKAPLEAHDPHNVTRFTKLRKCSLQFGVPGCCLISVGAGVALVIAMFNIASGFSATTTVLSDLFIAVFLVSLFICVGMLGLGVAGKLLLHRYLNHFMVPYHWATFTYLFVFALMTIEFFQVTSFSFLPQDADSDNFSVFKSAFEWSISINLNGALNLSYHTQFWIAIGIVAFILYSYSFCGTFVARFNQFRPLLDVIRELTAIPIVRTLVAALDCRGGDLAVDPTEECWTGSHRILLIASLLALLCYLPLNMSLTARPSSRLKELISLSEGGETHPEGDLLEGAVPYETSPIFPVFSTLSKMAITTVAVFFDDIGWWFLVIDMAFLLVNLWICRVDSTYPGMLKVRAYFMLMSIWACVGSFISSQRKDRLAYNVVVYGWAGISAFAILHLIVLRGLCMDPWKMVKWVQDKLAEDIRKGVPQPDEVQEDNL